MDLLKEAKELNGFVSKAEILKKTLKEFVAKKKVGPKKTTEIIKAKEDDPSKRKEVVKAKTRYIPKAVVKEIRKRDQLQCSFVTKDGKRCNEKHCLQMDHIKPFALGGSNEASNLRLLCPAHNQLLAEKTFGRDKIESYLVSTFAGESETVNGIFG